MITREVSEGLLCFRQMDHASLSGELALAWGGVAVPALLPGESVVFAAGNHDAGWPDLDDVPRFEPESRAPYSYRTHPLADALGVAERSVSRVAAADPYAGWLVSRHFASFYADSDDPRAIGWATEQVGRRAELLARAGPRVPREALHPHVLEANFDWVQLLDALSLALCHDWTRWESRPMALLYGEATGTYRYDRVDSTRRSETSFAAAGRVDPWPFAPDRIESRVIGRLLAGFEWEDDEALLSAWRITPRIALEVTLERG